MSASRKKPSAIQWL